MRASDGTEFLIKQNIRSQDFSGQYICSLLKLLLLKQRRLTNRDPVYILVLHTVFGCDFQSVIKPLNPSRRVFQLLDHYSGFDAVNALHMLKQLVDLVAAPFQPI